MQLLKIIILIYFTFIAGRFSEGKEYIIGVENTMYYPHYNFAKSKESESYAKAVFDLFAEKKGYKLRYYSLPIKRLKESFLVEKTLDFLYPDHPWWTPDMKKDVQVVYSQTVVTAIGGTLVLPENKGRGIDSFKKLGMIRGFTPFHWKELIEQKKVTISRSRDAPNLLEMVILGRVDGADMELSVANFHLQRMGKLKSLIVDPDLPYVSNPFHLSTIKHPEIIQEFDMFLKENEKILTSIKQRMNIIETIE
ncbi:hypothetical protein [Spartinivicinus poritis]|uniref:Solute-binding protein family 3/N-terminal domain-containing protein n=1 Tax=Spartinivicinus poritis TaxID=2994640 RepID=A0ABT5UAP4_9GAMM|nr:hypothetical protein [Spartinivicinus sp. A2-2]MDE1463245.1 hypothetical protein [Spartinivicinus sp. A2-2]